MTADAGRLHRLLNRVLSDDPLVRATAIQSAIFAFGTGTFITGEAVYSIKIIGLTVAEAGLGLTIGMASQFLVSIPFGRLADRIGARTCWGIGNALQAVAFLGWLFVHGFWPFIAVVVGREVTAQLGQIGWSTYRLAAFPREARVRSGAYNRAALNVGFTVGALFGGLALATGSLTVIRFIPILTAAILLVSATMIRRLPGAATQPSESQPAEARASVVAPDVPQGRPAIRNAGFVVTSFFDGLLSSHQTLLLTVIPLWLVADTNAPRVLLAWLFATNTIGAVLFQVPVSRTVKDLKTAMRAEARAAAFMVASCLIILVTDHTVIWLTIPLIWLAHVTVTGTELFESSASWSLQSELSDQSRLGDYQGVASVANTLGIIWTPAFYTFLATTLHATGWLIIAAIAVTAAVGIRPSARMAQRYLEEGPSAAKPVPAAAELHSEQRRRPGWHGVRQRRDLPLCQDQKGLRGGGRPRTRPDRVLADKAYGSRANRAWLRRRGIRATIPEKTDQVANRKKKGSSGGRPPAFDKERYKQRHAVECAINRLKRNRGRRQPLRQARRPL